MKFNHAIVRKPCKNMIKGLSDANLGLPNYDLAMEQHQSYCDTLKKCGVKLTILDADENFPDSTFVEDTAVLTKACAIITNPGASSRKGEIDQMRPVIAQFYDSIESIKQPGTLDGGDIMNVDDFYYVGLSNRTNKAGALQFIELLRQYGMDGTMVGMNEMLHLKTGLAYLGNKNLVVAGEFINNSLFKTFNKIKVKETEDYAANCININDKIIIPQGYPETKNMIQAFGYDIVTVDTSEFRKIDGGVSCLSLRFNTEK